jgi:predicted dehydrogenase
MKKVKVGVVGSGGICKSTYMENMVNKFAIVDVVGCADKIDARAQFMVDKYGIKKMTVDEMLADPEIEVIVNLTYPESHFEISSKAMKSGKHVYCEKMMAPTFKDATELMRLARENNVVYTTAPDTFLGAWEQSARKYLDDGLIGKPITVHAQCTSHYEPESPFFDTLPKHFFFPLHYGGGYPFDLGGYYLHEMINLFGSVKRVSGFGGNINPKRVYTNPHHPKYGETFEVNTPTTLMAVLEFENGVLGTFHISSDTSRSHSFMVTGSDGVLKLGDPNGFSDTITVSRRGANPPRLMIAPGQQPTSGGSPGPGGPFGGGSDPDAQQLIEFMFEQEVQLPLLHGFNGMSDRGVGLADMCYALRNNRRPRCHADIGYHSIEIIHAIQESGKTGKVYEMTTKCERPAAIRPSALSETGQEGVLDD